MKNTFYLLALIVLFSSCRAKYKTIPYFTDLPADSIFLQQITNQQVLKIQKDDILALTVSSLNAEASSIFNMGNASTSPAQTGNAVSGGVNGFLVDQSGNIQLPLIGSIKVSGMTVVEARQLIQNELKNYLKEPIVSLRIVNSRVSVLGDVARPGVFPIQQEQISLTEALTMAGDLNITAMRKNVLLIREEDGKRKFVRFNLNNSTLFESPYYYLRSNDIVYVQPSNAKYASVDTNYRNLSVALSLISIAVLIITRF
ncbi:polysaccharide biosynthesis/export family protein [Pedobacter frigoris]|uniref:polysaccharide biosynthesis/export family protein n=1 Tax=Pedobacter frigoris TaxID=2571272 RepID=UPI0029312AA5|nr:polysaccharide biosynthesis/export family protein [Pedobacter frigoris]